MDENIEKAQRRGTETPTGAADVSCFSTLLGAESRRGAISLTSSHPNQVLLAVCPDLSEFWDGSAWIINTQRLERAAYRVGIQPSGSPAKEVSDLFVQTLPYTCSETQRVAGVGLVRQREDFLIDELLGSNLMNTLELECYGGGDSATFQPLEANFDIAAFRVDPPREVEIDRSASGDPLLSRIVSIRNERLRALADKVAQRNLLKVIPNTGIEQPEYLDARAVNPPDSYVEFCQLSFAMFPLREIASTPQTRKKVWIFEDCRQGFAVVSDGKRQYVYSEHPIVRDTLTKYGLETSSRCRESFVTRLECFLTELAANPQYRVCLLKLAPPREKERLELARSILAYEGEMFVKSSRSSDGILVLLVSGKKGLEPVIRSDSVEVGELLKQYLAQIESARVVQTKKEAGFLGKLVLHEELNAIRKRSHLEGFLEKALSCMEAPIVEKAIPVARLVTPQGIEKVECRLIFQGDEQVDLVGHYVKASPNQIAANIACGGHSRRTYDVIYALHCQHLGGSVSSDEIERRVARSIEFLQSHGTMFARACADHYRSLMPKRPLSDFALDICPVWDDKRGTLRFSLLEIQFSYGFSGLTTTQPKEFGPSAEDLMAHRISTFRRAHDTEATPDHTLRQIEANFESLRTRLGISDDGGERQPRHIALRLLRRRLMEDL